MRLFECREQGAGDPVRWIAAPDEVQALTAMQKKGWTHLNEITPTRFIPSDPKALRDMGADVIVKEPKA